MIEPTASAEPPTPSPGEIRDATCLACGCLCDDIDLTVEGPRIIRAEHACERGHAWFLAEHDPLDWPEAAIEGRAASLAEAIDRAVDLLAKSRAPLVLGLAATTIEAQGSAVELAERLGAAIDPEGGPEALPQRLAFQRNGRVTASLGEVKNRADVVVFWNADPVTTHPRHLERYSNAPGGRFLNGPRTILLATETPNMTASHADLVLHLAPDRRFETLWAIRALVRGIELEDEATRTATGLDPEALREWAGQLQSARYGAFFLDTSAVEAAEYEAALLLVRDLNESRRFVLLDLGGPGNGTGAGNVLGWQTGYPRAVDFQGGYPAFLPGASDANARLESGAVDLVLIVGDDPPNGLHTGALDRLSDLPRIVIGPLATNPERRASSVAIRTATPGINAGGAVMRVDGVSLRLRPALTTKLPTDRDVIRSLSDCLLEPASDRQDGLTS